jgi:predicted nucleic acid-binding protein
MFLLDTNVISGLRRPKKADPKLLAWAQSVPVVDQYLSAVTILELEQGVLGCERIDAAQGKMLRAWFDGTVRARFAGRIVSFDEPVALCCAFLHVPNPKSYRDAMIGACAMVAAMTLVTRNTRDFIHMTDAQGKAIKLIDPYR